MDHMESAAVTRSSKPRRTRGTGSVIQRRPGVWQLRTYCGKDERGRKIYSYRTFKGSRTKAERELRRFQNEGEKRYRNGIIERSTEITFAECDLYPISWRLC
jgi:hypothetical protein